MTFNLSTKLFVLTTLIVAAMMACVTYFFTIRELESRRAAVASQMEQLATSIATMQLLDRQDWSVYQNYITQLAHFNDEIVYIAVYDDHGALRAHALNVELVDVASQAPLERRVQAEIIRGLDRGGVALESRGDLRTQRVNIQVGPRALGSVHVGFSMIGLNDELSRGIQRNIWMGLTFLVLAGFLSFFLSRRLTGPLERLSGAMTAIAAGDLEQRLRVENRDEIGRLALTFNGMVEDLRERGIIDRLGRELGSTFRLERLPGLIKERLGAAIGADAVRLFLRRPDRRGFVELGSDGEQPVELELSEAAEAAAAARGEGFLASEAEASVGGAFAPAVAATDDLVTPMLVKGQLFGLLFLSRPATGAGFAGKQRRLAATLASQAALALDNALLHEGLNEQARLRGELEIARTVQQRLLPSAMPELAGYDVDGVCIPAHEVGGDYFDFFPLRDGRLGLAVADVSGKGTSASFYMAELKGMMLALVPAHSSPRALLIELNRRLYGSFDRQVFATMIYGVCDPARGSLVFARAGHNPLLRVAATGKCQSLAPAGIGLGLESQRLFDDLVEEVTLAIDPGDTLLLYTDGFTEAMNPAHELFGETRLIEVARKTSSLGARAVREGILQAVRAFSLGEPLHDDCTLVVLKRVESVESTVDS